jgi:hypothetical protein
LLAVLRVFLLRHPSPPQEQAGDPNIVRCRPHQLVTCWE